MTNLKQLLQNQGENIGMNSKMFFKSHDVAQVMQFMLLLSPSILAVISLAEGGIKLLDIIGIVIGIFSLVYYIYYGKNQELYMERGEKYLKLYHEIEYYYKADTNYDEKKIEKFSQKINELNASKKPEYHIFVKYRVDRILDKELTYQNEKKPWYR